MTSVLICLVAGCLPYSPLATTLGFTPLPAVCGQIIAGFILAFVTLTRLGKSWFIRRWGY